MKMRMSIGHIYGIVLALAIVGIPWAYALHRNTEMRNFRTVREGVLYRSGQLTHRGLQRVVHDYRIKTIVSFRQERRPGDAAPDEAEEKWAIANGIKYVRIEPRVWHPVPGQPGIPGEIGRDQFFEVLADPKNHPVLVHCFAGMHRTGVHVALYRMEFEGWTVEQALQELRLCGYKNIESEADVFGYLQNYKPTRIR